MPISDLFNKAGVRSILLASSVTAGLAVQPTHAFDPDKVFKPDEEPRTVLRYGFRALKQGNMSDAIGAFRFGAERNNLAAEWKLARILQTGHGVPVDHVAAHTLYSKIANRYAEKPPSMRDRPYVSHAVVSLGVYALNGIEGTSIRANARRAEDHFYRAAALYKDPEAQYRLGILYRQGSLGVKQPRSAARWFGLAARKGHASARAQLGEMLFYGEGVRRRPVSGLVHMARAAARKVRGSENTMLEQAMAEASDKERDAARQILAGLEVGPRPAARAKANQAPIGGTSSNASRVD